MISWLLSMSDQGIILWVKNGIIQAVLTTHGILDIIQLGGVFLVVKDYACQFWGKIQRMPQSEHYAFYLLLFLYFIASVFSICLAILTRHP